MQLGYLISMMGLIIDISGGWLLAKSIWSRTPRQIYVESGTYWASNRYTFESNIYAAIDAKFAVPLLVGGFFGQLFGSYLETFPGMTTSPSLDVIFLVIAVIFIGLMRLGCHLRRKWWKRRIKLFFRIKTEWEKLKRIVNIKSAPCLYTS